MKDKLLFIITYPYYYIKAQLKNTKNLLLTIWHKICKKLKILKFKTISIEKAMKYLNAKGFKYEIKYQKNGKGYDVYIEVMKRKIGDYFDLRNDINKSVMDAFYQVIVRRYLTEIVNKKYLNKIKTKTRGVNKNTIFEVNRVKTNDGTYNCSIMKHHSKFQVVGFEKVA